MRCVVLRMFAGILLAASVLAYGSNKAAADWINLSGAETSPNIAEISVLEDRVRLALEIYVDDIKKMPELVPEDWEFENPAALPPISERMEKFSREKFQVVVNGTTNLTADLLLSEPRLRKDRASPFAGMVNPTTGQRSPESPADKRVLYVELEYPFDGKPETLTFIPAQDDGGRSVLPTGFILYHQAVPVIDFRYLTDTVTLELDWDDPWYSKFRNPHLKRHHRWPMMSYLYIDPREVRHEAIVRLRDLSDWIELDLKPGVLISPGQQAQIQDTADRFFAKSNPVEIDGTSVQAASVRSEYLELSLTGVQVIEDSRYLDPSTAVLGVILSYPTTHLPGEVSVAWELFNDRISKVPAISVDPAGPFPSQVTPDDPVHVWTNHLLKFEELQVAPVLIGSERMLKVSLITITALALALAAVVYSVFSKGTGRKTGLLFALLLGIAAAVSTGHATVLLGNPFAGLPGDTEASNATKAILENANAAFQEVDVDRRHSELELFLDPDAVSSVSTELDRTINIKVQGGTTARVGSLSDVRISEILPIASGSGFSALAEWTAEATGQHWGHTHLRSIRYRARIDLAEDKEEWRLAGLTVLDAELLP